MRQQKRIFCLGLIALIVWLMPATSSAGAAPQQAGAGEKNQAVALPAAKEDLIGELSDEPKEVADVVLGSDGLRFAAKIKRGKQWILVVDGKEQRAFDDISGIVEQLGLKSFVLIGLSMGGRNGMYYTAKRPEKIQKLVIVDIGPEISKRAAQPSSGPPEPDTWESIEQAAQHLYRGNPYPGIHYYRWVASHSLKQRPDGAIVWKWHPSVKERRSQLDLDWWALLKTITPPTLVLRGESSPILDRDVAERMAKDLPHGTFVEIPRAVHTLHEDNPEAVLAALKNFLGFQ